MSAIPPISSNGRLGLSKPTRKHAAGKPGINVKNRKYSMFAIGADEHELAQCLTKKKLHLLKAGARADNLPTRAEDQAKWISALREEPMSCIRDWFYANGSFDKLPDVHEACRILSNEAEAARLDKGECRLYWRAILAAFVQQQNSQAIEAFLQGSAVGQAAVLPTLLQDEGIRTIKTSQAEQPHYRNTMDGLSRGRLARTSPGASPGSTGNVLPLRLGDIALDDKSSFTAIGKRTTVLPSGQFFIQINGILLEDGSAVYLPPEDSKIVFPDSGDATAFPNTVHVGTSSAESLSVWRVEHKSPDKKVQYVITEFLSHTYEVFDLPHPSSEPDLVREWIKEIYEPASYVFPVFRLQDGPILKLSSDITDPRTANFDSPLCLYRDHPAVKWGPRTIIIKPFPASQVQYDCAPVRTAVKKLLRESTKLSELPSLTKRQISELADAADEQYTEGTIKQSILRAKACLEQFFENRDELHALMEDIVKLPPVAEAIRHEQERAAAAAKEAAESAKSELGKLAADKRQLQGEIENLKQARKKESAAVSREIRLAFEKAGAEGLKTLAEISLFKNILGLPPAPLPASVPAAPASADSPLLPELAVPAEYIRIADTAQLGPVFAGWHWHNGLSTRMLQALIGAVATQGVAILAGSRRHEAAAALGSTLAAGTGCTVSVSGDMFSVSDLMNASAAVADANGMHAMALGSFIAYQQAAGMVSVVRLRGANRVPPESLVPELLEVAGAAARRSAVTWTGKDGSLQLLAPAAPVVFLLELAQGRAVFPFMPPLAWEIPVIDTDAPWGDYQEPTAGVAAPCAAMDTKAFAGLLSAGAVPLPSARGLPRNAVDAARRMKGACVAAGLDAAASALIPIVVLAHCRSSSEALAAAIDAAGGDLAPAFKAYAAEEAFSQIFDMGAA